MDIDYGNLSSRPKVVSAEVISSEILIKSVCNISRSFSLDETKQARQMSNVSCP